MWHKAKLKGHQMMKEHVVGYELGKTGKHILSISWFI